MKIGKKLNINLEPDVLENNRVRINKRMKDLGLSGRREADGLIASKRVLVNGKIAKLGQSVTLEDDVKVVGKREKYKYIIFYKPKNVISHSPQYEEDEISDYFPEWDAENFTIVGRLDKHSEGLMLVTNDKRVVDKVLNPEFEHEREYQVSVQEKLSSNIVRLFAKGFSVYGRFDARPAEVEITSPFTLTIKLKEGKKHQIRLMLNELHYTVQLLKRVRIMNIKLGKLKPAESRSLTPPEIKLFLQTLKLQEI